MRGSSDKGDMAKDTDEGLQTVATFNMDVTDLPHFEGMNHKTLRALVFEMCTSLNKSGRTPEVQPLQTESPAKSTCTFAAERLEAEPELENWDVALSQLGGTNQPEPFLREVYDVRKHTLGEEHPDTLRVLNQWCISLKKLGRIAEAEPLERRLYEVWKRELGAEHPSTLMALTNWGSSLFTLRRTAEAEPLQKYVYEMYTRMHGLAHPDTMKALGNWCETLSELGRTAEAEPLQRRVFESRKLRLGLDHVDTLIDFHCWLASLEKLGRSAEAEPLHYQLYEASKRVLTAEHPDTMKALGNWLVALSNLGRTAEAEPLEREVFETWKRLLGLDHQDTLRALQNWCVSLIELGRKADLEPLLWQIYEIKKRTCGPEHPSTMQAIMRWQSTKRELELLKPTHGCEKAPDSSVGQDERHREYTIAEIKGVRLLKKKKGYVIVDIDYGADMTAQVVTKMKNLVAGLKIIYAPAGSIVQGKKIDATTIHNESSVGVICTAAEMGWEGDADECIQLCDFCNIGELAPANKTSTLLESNEDDEEEEEDEAPSTDFIAVCPTLKLQIRNLKDDDTFDIDIDPRECVSKLMQSIEQIKPDWPVDRQRLVYAGKELLDKNVSLKEANLHDRTPLVVMLRKNPKPDAQAEAAKRQAMEEEEKRRGKEAAELQAKEISERKQKEHVHRAKDISEYKKKEHADRMNKLGKLLHELDTVNPSEAKSVREHMTQLISMLEGSVGSSSPSHH